MSELLPVLKYPDPFLRRRAAKADPASADVRAMAARMVATMFDQNGLGLAATQVGWDARVAVVSGTGRPGDEIVIINPEVVDAWGSEAREEGCLSFPGVAAVITRRKGVKVRYTTLDGTVREIEDDGMLGRCCLHEIDHLDGVTFLSKMTPADKLANRRALKALEDRAADRASA
ncbi:MAG: Peptide deformylase [Planctomycetes bacterium]|nr:Peptide deformylase [Planctomycetota bacterium]